jgi:two-component system, sensor histidine kinase ChiS
VILNNYKKSILTDYFVIIGTMTIVAIVTLFIFGWIAFNNEIENRNNNLITLADRIERVIGESFSYVSRLAKIYGTEITDLDKKDSDGIYNILRKVNDTDRELKTYFGWTYFNWIDANKNMTIRGIKGESQFLDIVGNNHIKDLQENPWKMIFSDPIIGPVSGELITPASMGIVDNKGNFAGAISLGFSIAALENKLDKEFPDEYFYYILVNKNSYLILSSKDIQSGKLYKIEQSYIDDDNSGILDKPLVFEGNKYQFEHKISNTPFILFVGYDDILIQNHIVDLFIKRALLLCVIAIAFVVMLIKLRLSLVKPILMLANVAKEIAVSSQNYKIHLPKLKTYELQVLAKQLSYLLYFIRRLQQSKLKLKDNNKILANTNDRLESKVKERTKQLQNALDIKDEFLNNVSHEIRTPIHCILNYSDYLQKNWKDWDDDKKLAKLKEITTNTQRLDSFVGDILDIANIEIDKTFETNLSKDNHNIIESINYVCDEYKQKFTAKNISLNCDIDQTELIIAYDIVKIERVIKTLLDNALKYVGDGGVVSIFLKIENEHILIQVIDNGIGIKEGEEDAIFEAFTQGSKTKTGAGGAGLGLAVAKKIITAHNGLIFVKNNNDGGANFTIQLPIIKNAINSDMDNIVTEAKHKDTIVVIDDELFCLSVLEMMLTSAGYNVVTIDNSEEGLEYLKDHGQQVDLLMLDVMMPAMTGIELFEHIRKNPNLASIPVIFQTGMASESEIESLQYKENVQVIRKPFKSFEVLDYVSKILTNKND